MIAFLAGNLWWVLGLAVMAFAIVSLPALLRFRWQVAVAVFAIAAGVQWLHARDLQQEIAEQRAKAAEQALAYTESVRGIERAHVQTIANIAAAAAKEQADADREIDTLRARVRAGDLQLRKRFTCAQGTAGAATAAAAAVAGGEEGTGLGPADADFLVRIAAEGDAAIRERNLCIALAKEDRAMLQSLESQR